MALSEITLASISKFAESTIVQNFTRSCAELLDWEKFGYILVAIVATILLTELVFSARAQAQQRKTLPPGPRPWPILGNLHAIAGDALPHRALQKLSSKYGGLMYLRLGSVPCVVVSTAEAAREVFRANDDRLLSRPKGLYIESISGNYRTMSWTPATKYWRDLRKLASNELSSTKRHASYQSAREEEVCDMMKVLDEASKTGDPINLKSWLYELASNIMTRMLISKRYYGSSGAESEQDQQCKEEFQQYITKMKAFTAANIVSDYVPSLRFISETLQGWRSKLEAYRNEMVALGGKMLEVENHRQRALHKGINVSESYVPDFVDVFSAAPLDEGKPLPATQLTLVVLEMLGGGTESSSTTVEWAMAELLLRPHVAKRAQVELDAAVSSDYRRFVQESDLQNLPFLRALVKETLRLHPPAPLGLPRVTSSAVEAMGYCIPAETRVMLNIAAIQRDPAVYENPDEFNPERFLDHRLVSVNHLASFDSYELIPYGVGRRMCPGYNLGNTMVSLMLANLLRSYDWSLPTDARTGAVDMSESHGISCSLKEPLRLVPQLRKFA